MGAPDRARSLVDRLPAPAAAALARDLAGLAPDDPGRRSPARVRLLDLPPAASPSDEDDAATGELVPARDRLRASLGRTADGPVAVDLCREGPHALVAGTTGSGKSELLQTLIACLALNHRPDSARSCSSTTRAARRSPRQPPCRTPSAWSPTSTARRPRGPCAR